MLRALPWLAWTLITVAVAPVARAGKAVDGVVNLNTAPVEILGLLPGIGPAKASEIVVYRRKRPFRTVDELVRIKGIGRKMVRRLRAHLAVAGPTTASAARAGASPLLPVPAAPRPSPRPACPKMPVTLRPRAVGRRIPDPWPSHGACPRPR